MEQDPKDIFTKISDLEERVRLANDLVRLQGELLCKAPVSDDVLRLLATRIEGIARVVCVQAPGWVMPGRLPADVIASFSVGSDRYFMNTSLLDMSGGYYELDFARDIFHLQRRQSYRIRIPESHRSTYEIGRVNGQPKTITGAVFDVSSGGVRLVMPPNAAPLSADDEVEGVLNLGQKTALPFKGQIRHVKTETTARQILGVEFRDLTPTQENRLFSITMELHRELFARWE